MRPLSEVLRALAVAWTALCPVVVLSYQPLITDDTGTQGTGNHQLELSLDAGRESQAESIRHARGTTLVYTYGVSEVVDIFAGTVYLNSERASPDSSFASFGSLVIGAKWRMYEDEASGTSFALRPDIRLPASPRSEAEGLGVGKPSGRLAAVLTQDLPFGAVHFNAVAGQERFRDPANSPETTNRRASVAPAWHVNDAWKLVADFGLELSRAAHVTRRSRFVEVGAIYTPSNGIDLALGLIGAADDDRPSRKTRLATLGLTLHF